MDPALLRTNGRKYEPNIIIHHNMDIIGQNQLWKMDKSINPNPIFSLDFSYKTTYFQNIILKSNYVWFKKKKLSTKSEKNVV